MHTYPRGLGAGPGGDGTAVGKGEDGAPQGVFQADESCRAGVDVVAGDSMGLDVG